VQCSVCDRRFRNLAALNGHMRLHGGYVKYVKKVYLIVVIRSGCCVCKQKCCEFLNYCFSAVVLL